MVRRRKVFYLPGYDPFHPRRYRELYRREGADQAGISDYDIALRRGAGPYEWHVTSTQDGCAVETEVEVLVWSDIVKSSMSNSIPATYWQLVVTAWTYLRTGALARLMRLRIGPVLAALYPVVMLLFQLLVAVGLGVLAQRLILAVPGAAGPWGRGLSWIVMLGVIGWVLRLWRDRDNRIYAYYLMHDYAFSARWRGANPPQLEARMRRFGDQISAALRSDVDEVLVVGHSSGAHLALSILSDMIREERGPRPGGPVLSFLSLGQVVPMMSFLPDAQRLRADLAYLSTRDELFWLDVSAPGDGACFALCDPVAVSGVAPPDKRWPLMISAAYRQTLSEDTWHALRLKFFRLHFQYLCAFDRVGDYDYFRITAGPQTLAQRFAGRAPSRSVIDVPASKYTSVSP